MRAVLLLFLVGTAHADLSTQAPPASSALNIEGISLGMSEAEVKKLPVGKIIPLVRYGEKVVIRVQGNELRSGDKVVIPAESTAKNVRAMFGKPDRIRSNHVLGLIAGYYWTYEKADYQLEFTFVDDDFTKKDKAPLLRVNLWRKTEKK